MQSGGKYEALSSFIVHRSSFIFHFSFAIAGDASFTMTNKK